jgi:hypothetical protein
MTIREFNALSPRYDVCGDAQKAQIRELAFTASIEHERNMAAALSSVATAYSLFEDLEAFVTANSADFSVAERQELVAVRDKIRQAVADAANAIPGVSGATVA